MIESQLFLSTCSRRRWGRRFGFRRSTLMGRIAPALTTLMFAAVGFAAFWIGRFGI
jgi:hypothetical protein